MTLPPDRADRVSRETRRARLFHLNEQAFRASEPTRKPLEERVVSPSWARDFQAEATRSLRDKPGRRTR